MDHNEVEWDMDWIDLALDRDRWRALLNAVANLSGAVGFSCRILLQRDSHGDCAKV